MVTPTFLGRRGEAARHAWCEPKGHQGRAEACLSYWESLAFASLLGRVGIGCPGGWSLCPPSVLGFSLEFRDFLRLNWGLVSGIHIREGSSGGENPVPLLVPQTREED